MPRYIDIRNLQQFTAINLTSDPGYDPDNRTIPNCAQITLNWALASGLIGNTVMHASYQGPFAGSQAQADAMLTGLIGSAQWTALKTYLADTAGLMGVLIRDLNQADQPIINSIASGSFGTAPPPALPSEVAAVLTLRTAFTGPQNRGRIYVPGWGSNAVGTGDAIISGAYTALGQWGSIIAGVLQASGYVFGVGHFSRKAYIGKGGKQHPARPPGLVPITNVVVRDQNWDTQRRRGRK